jgi:ABC-type polysaccharide/polyol phosphate transport system ATPase subunit
MTTESGLPAIAVRHVSKKFARSLKRAMAYGLVDIGRAALVPHRFRSANFTARLMDASRGAIGGGEADSLSTPHSASGLRPSEFWALRDVSLDVCPGDCLGLIGANGAGKSTLFSVLSGIYGPTEGRVEIRGRLQALIALGAGFHPMLSGRENIYINAAILGLTTRETDRVLDRIIEFSELGEFADAPVKTYSSGMLVRLGFSVAAHLDPDVMLIDEVLAVGDAAFQRKCMEFSRRLAASGKTIVLVAHNMLYIQSMCNRVVWLDHGKIVEDGPTHAVVDGYKRFMTLRVERSRPAQGAPSGPERLAIIERVRICDREGRAVRRLDYGAPFCIEADVHSTRPIEHGRFWLYLATSEQDYPLMAADMFADGHAVTLPAGSGAIRVRFERLPAAPGSFFRAYVGLRDTDGRSMLADSFATETVEVSGGDAICENGPGPVRVIPGVTNPAVAVAYRWEAGAGTRLH